jgi:hypothetical protein
MEIKLDYVRTTNCQFPIMAKATIDHGFATIPTGAAFTLESSSADPSDLYNYETMLNYMSYGIYMSYNLYMGGDDIPSMASTYYDVTNKMLNGEDTIYLNVDPSVVNGQKTMLFRLEVAYTDNDPAPNTYHQESSDYVLGYMPVPKQPLAGFRKMETVPERQLFRGKHSSAKYNRMGWETGRELTYLNNAGTVSLYSDYKDVLLVEHLSKLIRM